MTAWGSASTELLASILLMIIIAPVSPDTLVSPKRKTDVYDFQIYPRYEKYIDVIHIEIFCGYRNEITVAQSCCCGLTFNYIYFCIYRYYSGEMSWEIEHY